METLSLNAALNRSASGLKQIASAQANTAHNLNAEQAIAGKAKETFFSIYTAIGEQDTVPSAAGSAGALEGKTINRIGKAGTPTQSMEKTHMALTGDRCFFPVKDESGNLFYTRIGSFKPNGDNLYANQFGLVLQYVPVDGSGNLPQAPALNDLRPLSAANQTISAYTSANISVGAGLSGAIGTVVPKNFNVIDASGTPRTLMFNFERVSPPAGSTSAQAWRLTTVAPAGATVRGDATSPYGDPAYGLLIEFDANGKPAAFKQGDGAGGYAPVAAPPNLNIGWPGGVPPSSIALNLGTIGNTDGVLTVSGGQSFLRVISDGYQTGTLTACEIDENGQIFGKFSNNQAKLLGRLALGAVNNPDAMEELNKGCFAPTSNTGIGNDYSGAVYFLYAGEPAVGQIAVGALESSNVDVIAEMSGMVRRELQFSVVTAASQTARNMWGEAIRATKT